MTDAAALLQEAVADRVCTAAALLASRRGGGTLSIRAGSAVAATRFDLASLTKALYTTAAAMLLVDDGRLDLEAPTAALLPEWGAGARAGVSLRQLLHHEAGVPWWRPMYTDVCATPDGPRDAALLQAVRDAACALPLEAAPGESAVYSDPGFVLLELALERAAGEPLPALARDRLWLPLGADGLRFVDLKVPGERERALAGAPYAPTEDCPWRGRRLVAEVHDDNAHAMGGIAGHAGLFGTAQDVSALGAGLLACLDGGGPLSAGVVRRFFTERGRADGTTRVLGWDTPTPGTSSAGRYVSPRAVGHLGFTGTSLWIDPAAGVVTVLLTNRVYYGRKDGRIRALRPRVHDAVYEALGATRCG